MRQSSFEKARIRLTDVRLSWLKRVSSKAHDLAMCASSTCDSTRDASCAHVLTRSSEDAQLVCLATGALCFWLVAKSTQRKQKATKAGWASLGWLAGWSKMGFQFARTRDQPQRPTFYQNCHLSIVHLTNETCALASQSNPRTVWKVRHTYRHFRLGTKRIEPAFEQPSTPFHREIQ